MRIDRGRIYYHVLGVGVMLLTSISLVFVGTLKFHNVCTRGVLTWPMVAFGIFLMLISLIAFVIFGYVAVGGVDLRDVTVREYKLEHYSGWLRDRVAHPNYWAQTSTCLRHKDVCNGMKKLIRDPETGIYSGCCKPPSWCALTYENGTTWTPTPAPAPAAAAVAKATTTNVDDCSRWSNDQETLCFQCDSCKAGLLDHTKKEWSMAAIAPVLALIWIILSGWATSHMAYE
uniref:Tetraspanin n=1 Tax=Leersia perrieri TaxID=77586 RepID=A0A0D9W1I6_9ORYZ